MQIVIDIPEDTYKATCNESMLPPDVKNVVNAIKNGTPLPKGHEDLIDRDEAYAVYHNANLSWNGSGLLKYISTVIPADK